MGGREFWFLSQHIVFVEERGTGATLARGRQDEEVGSLPILTCHETDR